jgi:hypothetical protein
MPQFKKDPNIFEKNDTNWGLSILKMCPKISKQFFQNLRLMPEFAKFAQKFKLSF